MNNNNRFAISFQTAIAFERRVRLSTHWARLRPAPHTRAAIAAYTLAIDAEPHFINWVRDPFENYLARLDFHEPLQRIALNMELVLDLTPVNPFDFLLENDFSHYPLTYSEQLHKELIPYLYLPVAGSQMDSWLSSLKPTSGYLLDTLSDLNQQVHESLKFEGVTSPGPVNIDTVLSRRTGSAWEIAWLLTLGLRHFGLAARFVSGLYLFQSSSDEIPDHGALHAWSEVFLPGAGWVGLDPANGILTTEGYIPLATAPDPLRALPLVGYFEACNYHEQQQVQVSRLTPHLSTQHVSDAQWHDMGVVARHVDKLLDRENIQAASAPSLSFVASAYANDPEWSIQAMGGSKRNYAENLLSRLSQRLAPGIVVQAGQGEWFSGEPLPRWRLYGLYRRDGVACWQDPRWLAANNERGDCSFDEASQFIKLLAKILAIDTRFVLPAYEDQLHQLWMSRGQMAYLPDSEELRNPILRQQLADRLSQSRDHPSAYVLPIRWDPVSQQWKSGCWQFRRQALYLVPGDSPPGFRLPLTSLPRNRDAVVEADPDRCQFEPREVLPSLHGELAARLSNIPKDQVFDPASAHADDEFTSAAPRTALCIDVRDGHIHIFLPPLTHLEYYLELVAAIETVAARLQTQVVLEGYEPPYDARVQRFILEPDAGVLKLTLPEAENWDRVSSQLNAAYEEAAALGLYAERYSADGRRMPSGGGAELTVGGTEPALSPFLKQPAILRSFITFWHNHPSLSYFFAGRMIGASGDAPRVDEGRDDALYDLDMALRRIPDGLSEQPWVPDRILRHLLTDTKGDMRRAEIRVDQLYPPERSATRLGRITIRSFEMAPSMRLAALQWLLTRSLLASFAIRPQAQALINWKGATHDRFLLPDWLWQDFQNVLQLINEIGIPLQAEWFSPYLELRFPALGNVQIGDLNLELRTAHENWPLLAEEFSGHGVSRFIDIANERVQVRLMGATPDRYAVVCNDKRVPLRECGQNGKYVGGVRYKTSNPLSTLHPTREPVRELVFDVVDTWTGKVIGGCTWLPPLPAIYGPVGLPPLMPYDASKGPIKSQPLVPAIAIPPWQQSQGRFLSHGSGRTHLLAPLEATQRRYPNLLDLTRI